MRKAYPSDLSPLAWKRIARHFRVSYARGGRPLIHSKQEIFNAILYVVRTGCQWRHLPHDFPPWKTVYEQFRSWKQQGIFEKLNQDCVRAGRRYAGRSKEPRACIAVSR